MKYSLAIFSIVCITIAAKPFAASALGRDANTQRGTKPAATVDVQANHETNTNSDANDEAAKKLTDAKERSQAAINTLIQRITAGSARIEENKKMPKGLKAQLLADFAQDQAFLQKQQQIIAQAQTIADVRSNTQLVRQYMKKRKERIQERRANFTAQLQSKLTHAQEVGTKIVSRLNTIVEFLQQHSIDTATLEEQIAAYESSVNDLSSINVEENPKDVQAAIKEMRAQLKTILTTVKDLVE